MTPEETRPGGGGPWAAFNDPRRCDYLTCKRVPAMRCIWPDGAASVYCQSHAEMMVDRYSRRKPLPRMVALPQQPPISISSRWRRS